MAKQLLRFTLDEAGARSEVAHLGGRIIHQFSPAAFVAELPDAVDPQALSHSTATPVQALDAPTQLAVDAWLANESRKATPPPHTEGLPWDSPGYKPPLFFKAKPITPGSVVELSTDVPTSRYLIGSVAVGVVLVSRNQGAEVMTSAERTQILSEIQAGLTWLAGVEPLAQVSFVYDIQPVTVTATPGPAAGITDPFEQYEQGWRDAALAVLGYGVGPAGYQAYANALVKSKNTSWGYVIFASKYTLNHFAYASNERVVIGPNDAGGGTNWGGWGITNIHRFLAHESCHICGAEDEYGSCTCGSQSGHLRVANNNCVNCFPPGSQAACLMNQNTQVLCDWSRGQIGWIEETLKMRTYMQSIVFGKQNNGNPANEPSGEGFKDYSFTPPGSTRVIGGWWALQEDASDSDAFKQFSIGGPSGSDNDIPDLETNSITFRVHKKNNGPGLIRVNFFILYV
jgi:hypothetical protein